MSVASFTRHLTLSLAFVAVAWASPRQADAAVVTQSQNFTLGSSGLLLNWAQFDAGLGMLTHIEYEVQGTLSGSFSVSNNDNTNSVNVFDSLNRFRTTFQGTGAPTAFFGATTTPVNTMPSSGLEPGTTVAPGATQVFTLAPGQGMVSNTVDFFPSFATYFTGNATVTQLLTQVPAITVTGANVTLTSDVQTVGTATLRYIYDINDPTVIPEPFTAAFTGLLIGGGAIVGARRKRRLAKADKKS